MKTNIRPFHLAIPVTNLETAKKFYINLLDCKIGRSSNSWIDLNFFGHQLVLHLSKKNKFDEKLTILMVNKYQYHILELF